MNKFQTGILSLFNLSSVKTHEGLELGKMTKNVSKPLEPMDLNLLKIYIQTWYHIISYNLKKLVLSDPPEIMYA